MIRLRTTIKLLLSEYGRIPPGETDRVSDMAREAGLDDAGLRAEVERIVGADATLTAKRRLVMSTKNRAQLQGSSFNVDAVVDKASGQVESLGWDVEHFRDIARQIERENRLGGSRAPDGPDAQPGPAPAPARQWPRIAALAAILAVVLSGATAFLLRDQPTSSASRGVESAQRSPDFRALFEKLEYVASFPGAVDADTRARLESLVSGAGDRIGPQLVQALENRLLEAETVVWPAVAADPSVESLRRFLAAYPDGRFADRAESLLARVAAERRETERVTRLQQEFVRLGREIPVTGRLDDATLALLSAYAVATGRKAVPDVSAALIDEIAARDDWPRRPGEIFSDCGGCPAMVVIPAGEFAMGSRETEPGSEPNERPVHRVDVARFALGRTEVTFEQWTRCVEAGACDFVPPDEGWGREQRPVVNVSWSDALQYLRWLTQTTGHEYRLPSEAEWEYAARAGTTTRFYTGACITSEQANFDGRLPSDACPESPSRGRTLPAASFPPNPFGLYDMAGNVREWTRDCWNDDYRGAPADGSAWMDGDCSRPVLRDGSWSSSERAVRSANRTRPSGAFNDARTGFRPARDIE